MSNLEAQATLQARIETLTEEVHAYARAHASMQTLRVYLCDDICITLKQESIPCCGVCLACRRSGRRTRQPTRPPTPVSLKRCTLVYIMCLYMVDTFELEKVLACGPLDTRCTRG